MLLLEVYKHECVLNALLQSRLMAYKDASKLAGGYATAGTKSLAPDMAAQLAKVRHHAMAMNLFSFATLTCVVSSSSPLVSELLAHHTQMLCCLQTIAIWSLCPQARQEVLQLLVQLRTGDCSQPTCPAHEALQQIKALQQQHAQLLELQRPHLQAATMFKQPPVAAAAQVGG
jgi:hypothetical protein